MTTPATVLIVSRDKTTSELCTRHLKHRGYAVAAAPNLRHALAQAKTRHLDAIVIDLASLQTKPERFRSQLRVHSLAPLVFIVRAHAKLDGLRENGATLTQPIAAREFVATVKEAIAHEPPHQLTRGPFRLDLETRVLICRKKNIHLMKKEFAVLQLLMQHTGELVTRRMLMREIWETDYMGDTRMLDVYTRWLRMKIEENPSEPRHLITVRGQGYRFQIKETK